MKIAFYMHDLSGGGVERMRLALMAALQARGVQVSLVVGMKQGPLVALLPPDLPLTVLNCTHTLKAIWPLRSYVRRKRPDFLISSLDHNNVAALLAGFLAGTGVCNIICQHNALSEEMVFGWRYRVIPFLYWLLQKQAHGIIAVSHGVAADLAKTAHIPAARIDVIYNPVVGADFTSRMAQPVQHPWLAQEECPVVAFAGRLTAQKAPDILLEATALVRPWQPIKLLMMGEGELMPHLQARAAALGLEDCVDFLGFQPNALPYIAAADLLVSCSRYEGLGNVIIEALACGTPVVATDCPHGPAEILADGQFGWLVKPGNAAELAASMAQALAQPKESARLQARAAQFSADACAQAHLALCARIMARRHQPVAVLGLRLSKLRADQVIEQIMAPCESGAMQLVVTPNLDHLRLLRRPEFAAAYRYARLVCPDGFPILLYAKLRGLALRERVTGCALFRLLVRHPGFLQKRVCLVVESEATAQQVAAWAVQRGCAGTLTCLVAPAGLAQAPAAQMDLAQAIAAAAADIVVLTLGAPTSECFAYAHRAILGRCWVLCLGQAVRVELGMTQRAPAGWQRAGLEWLWRIRQEPRRLAGRYAAAALWFPVAVWRDLRSI